MSSLSDGALPPTELAPYAAFIARHLRVPLPAGGGMPGGAVSETEALIDGDRWFWADDNAKVLEMFARPDLWRQYPAVVQELFDFLRACCDGPFIYRRLGVLRLDLRDGVLTHSLLRAVPDLARGTLTLGMRFHDGRDARNLILTGNYVQFTHAGIRHTVDVEDAISGHEIRHEGERVVYSHWSELFFPGAWDAPERLGLLRYTYTIHGRSNVVGVEVSLELEPRLAVSDVVLTVAQDDASHGDNYCDYGTVFVQAAPGSAGAEAGGNNTRFDAAGPGHTTIPARNSRYVCVAQNKNMAGFALAVHVLPRDGMAPLDTVEATVRDAGRLHYVVSHYRFPGRQADTTLRAAEDRIIAAGGFYDQVDGNAAAAGHLVAGLPHSAAPLDLSVSYDYGAEIHALARCVRVLRDAELRALTPGVAESARELLDRLLEAYLALVVPGQRAGGHTVFSRQLAFVVLGLVAVAELPDGERYRPILRDMVDLLLTFEQRFPGDDGSEHGAFLMGTAARAAHVDCHSAVLAALCRAAPLVGESRVTEAIRRAVRVYGTTAAPPEGHPHNPEILAVRWRDTDGHLRVEPAWWNFTVGLTLRAFAALRDCPLDTVRAIRAEHAAQLDRLEVLLRRQVAASIKPREDALEIRTSIPSAEGNSETQPWVALGLAGDPGG
ncbi:hypothetical protein [Roseomonas elaeocarpi]|uniref:Heparin-sulfate lyase N-terminal domain-containing protein n=1 Tax=Roseomonas elaeocarpi TaxID=907779 RepID=A0ABV6JRN9_9PROT